MEKIKIAAIQMSTVADKMENVRTVKTYLEKIKDENLDFVILPEMFCCPYQTENFPIYAEKEGGPVWQQLSGYAKQYGIYLIGGSMPEKDAEGNVYNTSYRSGNIEKYIYLTLMSKAVRHSKNPIR